VKRFDVMYNDFVLIGPNSDPAGVKGRDIETALKAIQAKGAPFVSRGDKSGTHSAELALWKQAGIDIDAAKGRWYREIGQGMGAALNTAAAMNGYVLCDRGTWIFFRNRGGLEITVEGDRRLFNQYGVMLVSPEKYPSVKKEFGQAEAYVKAGYKADARSYGPAADILADLKIKSIIMLTGNPDKAEDLKREWFENKKCVGLTAGASAPEVLVKRVVAQIREWGGEEPQEAQGQQENVMFSLPRELRRVATK